MEPNEDLMPRHGEPSISRQGSRPSDDTRIKLVVCCLWSNGPVGVSALSGLTGQHELSFRNSIIEWCSHHGSIIVDEFFDHQHVGGGVTSLKRYRSGGHDKACKVADLVNSKRKKRWADPLGQNQIIHCLTVFPSNTGLTTAN